MRWPPFDHVFFDCDSTLTQVEGIDVLAEAAGRSDSVREMTDAAMRGEIDLEDVYGARLAAIQPSRSDIRSLRQVYKDRAVPDAALVVAVLQELGHNVYVVSGGLTEPVTEFGVAIGIPKENIRAVGIEYDLLAGDWWSAGSGDGKYLDYGRGALAVSEGKKQIIRELIAGRPGRRLLIGDGTSDLLAADAVDLFVGYGGVAVRPRVKAEAPIFLTSLELAPVLPLAAGPSAQRRLEETSYRALFGHGIDLAGRAQWNAGDLRDKFAAAVEAKPPA